MHGFHIHEFGDISLTDCTSAKKHWNPHKTTHGDVNSIIRHIGDLGNVNVSTDGTAQIFFQVPADKLPLVGPDSIVGRALVIHQGQDDLGIGGQTDSNSTGHAGSRLGCGVIGMTSDFSAANLDPGMRAKHPKGSIRKAIAVVRSSNGSQELGIVYFVQQKGIPTVRISGNLGGISSSNSRHVLHVHQFGSANCSAAGGVLDDLGSIYVDGEGLANFSIAIKAENFPLIGSKSIIGRTLVLHQGDHDNSGSKLLYCLI